MSASKKFGQRIVAGTLPVAFFLSAAGCGADFDSPDIVKTLRVLGVQKDHPYASPTTDPANPTPAHLSMLWYDGAQTKPEEPRNIQRLWFSGCDDLPGDQYFTCLARMYVLWAAYTDPKAFYGKFVDPPPDIPTRNVTNLELDGGKNSWSPVDDIAKVEDPLKRAAVLQMLAVLVNPSIPPEYAESYLGSYRIGLGDTFEYPIPPRIIENHQPSSDPTLPPYGLSFIFFTVCAGHIDLAPAWKNIDLGSGAQLRDATLGFPFSCYDENGAALGPDDFVGGYTQQFVYAGDTVNNPAIESNGVVFPGTPTNSDAHYCVGDGCLLPGTPSPALCSGEKSLSEANRKYPHVPACSGKCPTYDFRPDLNRDNPDNVVDVFASQGKAQVGKQMWINYYTDKGSLKHPVRLLRDTTTDWNDDHGASWTPPAEAGPVNLWAVVHDTRGGVAWTRLNVCVD